MIEDIEYIDFKIKTTTPALIWVPLKKKDIDQRKIQVALRSITTEEDTTIDVNAIFCKIKPEFVSAEDKDPARSLVSITFSGVLNVTNVEEYMLTYFSQCQEEEEVVFVPDIDVLVDGKSIPYSYADMGTYQILKA